MSVPLSQDHRGMPGLHTLCQCHCLKTTEACRGYTLSVSATVSRPHRHAGVTHSLSVPLSQDHTGMPGLHTLCQCHCLKTTQACRSYTLSVSATVSRPHRHAGVTHSLSVPLSQDHTGMPGLHTLCQCHCLKTTHACRGYTLSVSATVSRPHRHAGVTHSLSVPLSQDHTGMPGLHTLCQCHCLKTTQACRGYTLSVSATVSRPHRHAGVTHSLSVPLSQDHTGMPGLHTLCQCHCLKTTQACRGYTLSVSATVSRPHRHAGVTHSLSVPLSQDHTCMPGLHTLCQCHCLKTTQACRGYTLSVSATVSRPHRHAGVTHSLSVPLSQDHTGMPGLHTLCQCHCLKTTQACRGYTLSVSATVSRPHRHAGVTHSLSVPLSQDHTGMPGLHTLCQCHCLKTTQACRGYTLSVSATVSRPHRHAGVTHSLSVPLSQDHTCMPGLHTLCQCHCLKTTQACRGYTLSVSATVSRPHRHAGVTHSLSVPLSQDHTGMPGLHTLCQCHCLKTTQACRGYTLSVSATVSRPHMHAGVTHSLSVPLSQDHTGMPGLHTLCQCHCLKTTQACRGYTLSVSATVSRPHRHAGVTHSLSVPLSQDHTGMPGLHTLCQCHCLKTTQACRGYTLSVSATVSRPHRHAGVTHSLSVPLSQDHTGMPGLHTLCQCHCLKTTQACRGYTLSVSATVSRPHMHAGVTHSLSVPLSQDHTGMPGLHTLCQCHCLKTTQACRGYTLSVSATVSRPHRHAGVTHSLSVPLSQDHTGMPGLHTLCQCHCLKTTQACRGYTLSVSATVSRPHRLSERFLSTVVVSLCPS